MLFSEPLFSLASAKVRHFAKLTKKIQLFFIGNEKTLFCRVFVVCFRLLARQ